VAKQKFGLGRGLDALISGASDIVPAHSQQVVVKEEEAIPQLPIETIIPNPRQPRRFFTDDDPKLLELSNSIKEHGLLQPIVVTRLAAPSKKDKSDSWFSDDNSAALIGPAVQYQIIAGERRWRAARMAGLNKVPAVIKDVNAQQMLELALIENIQRADLNPIEEALAYQALTQEFGLTQEMVAKQVGKDRTTINNSMRLLQLVPKVREALINRSEVFTEGHGRALIGIEREENQIKAMEHIIAMKLNVREAELLATRIKSGENLETAVKQMEKKPERPPQINEWIDQFREALCVKVDLNYSKKGKGTIVLHFNNQDELDSLYARLVKGER
jgi:ParB family chromosome partitioning protein